MDMLRELDEKLTSSPPPPAPSSSVSSSSSSSLSDRLTGVQPEGVRNEKEEKMVKTFQEVTRTLRDEAIHILESCNWELQQAVTLQFGNENELRHSGSSYLNGIPVTPQLRSRHAASSVASPDNIADDSSASFSSSSSSSSTNGGRRRIEEGGGGEAESSTSSSSLIGALLNLFRSVWHFAFRTIFFIFKLLYTFLFGSGSSQSFAAKFERNYGGSHPKFFQGTFQQAVSAANRDLKILVVYIHNDLLAGTQKICREILCNPDVVKLLDENFIVWGEDTYRIEGNEVSRMFRVRTYPYMCLLLIKGFDHLQQIAILEGANFTLQKTLTALQDCLLMMDVHREEMQAKKRRNEYDRILRAEQDKEYQEALRQDADRQKQKLLDEQKEVEMRRKNEEKIQMEEKKKKLRAEKTEKIQKDRKKVAEEFKQKMQSRSNPSEESQQDAQMTKICMRLPSGVRIEMNFKASDLVKELFMWAQCAQFLHHREDVVIPNKFQLSVPLSSIQLQNEINRTFKEVGLCPNALVLLTFLDESESDDESPHED